MKTSWLLFEISSYLWRNWVCHCKVYFVNVGNHAGYCGVKNTIWYRSQKYLEVLLGVWFNGDIVWDNLKWKYFRKVNFYRKIVSNIFDFNFFAHCFFEFYFTKKKCIWFYFNHRVNTCCFEGAVNLFVSKLRN